MKKQTRIGLLLLFFMAICLLLTPTKADAAIVDSGSCGTNLTWTLDDQGLLTISGTGAMTEWQSPDSWGWGVENSPWNYNYDITQVVIEEGVTSIGDYSFYMCENMMSIQIPDSVISIGRYAFFRTAISEVTISKNVTEIGQSVFHNCYYLETISVDPQNPYYANDALGGLYSKDFTTLITIPNMITGSFAIPEGVITIEPCAFWYHYNLTEVTIPDTVTSIGGAAFSYCYGLTEITIPGSVVCIGGLDDTWVGAFQGCENLESVTLTDGLEAIGYQTFAGCYSLTNITIPDTVTSIGYGALTLCTSLKSIVIPDSVTYMDNEVFYGDTALESVVIGAGITSIGGCTFKQCSSLTQISVLGNIESIDYEAFMDCTSLENIDFLDNLSYIGESAFEGTAWYENLPEEGLIYFGAVAYEYRGTCPETVTIQEGTLNLSANIFAGQSTLVNVILPEGLENIGSNAFGGCTNLSSITFPDSIVSVGDYAFGGCDNLTTINVPNKVFYIGFEAFCYTAWYDNQPDGVVHLGVMAIGCKGENLEHVTVREGTTHIVSRAFWYGDFSSISLPSSLVEIGDYAFQGYSQLDSIVIPENVTYIGSSAFGGTGLSEIIFLGDAPYFAPDAFANGIEVDACVKAIAYYPSNNSTWTADKLTNYGGQIAWIEGHPDEIEPITIAEGICGENLTWTLNNKGLLTISGTGAMYDWSYTNPWSNYQNRIKIVAIEEGVSAIGDYAFYYCSRLSSITIPNSVTTIGNSAFSYCYHLSSIIIPNSVTAIGTNAFSGCECLTTVTIPGSVTTIEYSTFSYCDGLTNVTIEDGVKTINNRVFEYCENLTSVTMPDSITTIGSNAFYGCYSLLSVTIPKNVVSIGNSAFYNCKGLNEINFNAINTNDLDYNNSVFSCAGQNSNGIIVTIGAQVQNIPDYLFYPRNSISYTPNITAVIFEEGSVCQHIGVSAFSRCENLTSVIIPDSVTTISNGAFSMCEGLLSLTIGSGVESIGYTAFHYCTNLTEINFNAINMDDIPGYDYVFSSAGHQCSDGITVTIGAQVQKIPAHLFCPGSDAPNITTVVFEKGSVCQSVGYAAFSGCTNLKNILFMDSAPSISANVFANVTATVYYPANNSTWTEEVRQNYGGTITWVAYEPEPEIELFDIDVARMILGNSLEFQFGVEKANFTTTEGYYAIIEKTWADGTTTETTVPATKWVDAGDYWAIPYDRLAAKEMADDFYVTIYNAQGMAVSNKRTDSVRDYVMRNIDKQNTVGKILMVDMLNYGAFAQTNFSYGTENLANNQLTDAQKAYATAQMQAATDRRVQGTNYLGTRLVLESRIQLQLAFKNLTADKYAIYTFTNNSGVKQNIRVDGTEFIDAGSAYVVEASELVCADARALVTFTVYNADGTVYATASDSIESYVARNTSNEAVIMLMKFADSAKTYLYG